MRTTALQFETLQPPTVEAPYQAIRAAKQTARVLDELQIHQLPVLCADGRRLFELLLSRIKLEIIQVTDTPQATHIRYCVRR